MLAQSLAADDKADAAALAAQELLRRSAARDNLHDFVRQGWPIGLGGRKFVDGWHIGAVCEHLEAVSSGQIKYLIINVPPRTTKSWVVSVFWPAWDWIKTPQRQWLFTSYTSPLSTRDSLRTRRIIRSTWYQARWGKKFTILDDGDTRIRFDNDMGGYRIASSVDGTNTGEGGDFLVYDDPNSARDTSDVALESAIQWFDQVMPTRLNDFVLGAHVVIQQRVHEKDITGHILADEEEHGAVHLMLPLEFESARRCITVPLKSTNGKPWQDPRTKEGEVLCPERFPPDVVKKLKRKLGSEYAIAGQLQQRPSPTEGGIIKKKWFKIWKSAVPPKLEFVLQSWDTALSERKKAAFSACTTWGIFHDEAKTPNIILLSIWRERVEYPELRRMAQQLARDYLDDNRLNPIDPKSRRGQAARKPDMIIVEAKANGLSLIQDLMKAGVNTFRFDPDKHGDKTQRVRMITHLIEGGRVWVPGKLPDFTKPRDWADLFIEQTASFPNAASRDLVDSMTQALIRFSKSGWVWHPEDVLPPPRNRMAEELREAVY